MAATIIAVVSILVAVTTFVLTYLASVRAERRGRMPVLVLLPDEHGWRLENIGGGPALNIVIAQGRGPSEGDGLIQLLSDTIDRDGLAPGEHWFNPIHLRPMPAGGSQVVPFAFSSTGVGVSFTDALGSVYTLRTSRSGSLLMERRGIPRWQEGDWRQLSELEQGDRMAADMMPTQWGFKS